MPIDAKDHVVALEHQPHGDARGQIVLLHGLEGSADAGYLASFSTGSDARLRRASAEYAHLRGNRRSVRDDVPLGLTGDTRAVLEELQRGENYGPLYLVGFSLGGNVALKLAGELGETCLLNGVVAISTPIDLARSVRAIDRPSNFLYARRFLDRLKGRVRRKSRISPDLYKEDRLEGVKTIWEFDDRFTAPLFGFGTAANYYATQSAINFLPAIPRSHIHLCGKRRYRRTVRDL